MKPAVGRLVWMALCVTTTACAAPMTGNDGPRQVIIGFTAPTDTAAPATLASLAHTSQAAVSFVAAISPHSAAYRLDCPPADPACDRAIAALRAHPAVRYLEPDRMKDSR